jgi:hypothetical protein
MFQHFHAFRERWIYEYYFHEKKSYYFWRQILTKMNEDFLQFIWNLSLYDATNLKTSEGEDIEIISTGVLNKNSGPDFYDAKIRIGDTMWAGTVEIHKKSSEWNLHGHQNDNAYNNVILHVVEKDDAVIRRKTGERIPCLELTYPERFKQRYIELSKSKQLIPCTNYIVHIDGFKMQFWLNKIAVERFEQKTDLIKKLMLDTCCDLEEVFHCTLFRYFGFKTNSLPFEMLARSLPAKILRKYSHSIKSLEAVLFGQAGFLDDEPEDEYSCELQKEYRFLKHKYDLVEMDRTLWKYTKLRPINFPTIRIAQLAAVLNKHQRLWHDVIGLKTIKDVYNVFDVTASEYWNDHYIFGKTVAQTLAKRLGKNAVDILIINALVPTIFAYSTYYGNETLSARALDFLESLTAESNSIINEWIVSGIKPANALESQALIHLQTEYCDNRKCLKCDIGKEIIKNIMTQ